jgi:starch synthase
VLRVLYVTSEVYPLLKTGGLGDVSAALPPALLAQGVDVRLLVPGFPAFTAGLPRRSRVAGFGPAFGAAAITVERAALPGSEVPIYLLVAPELYDRPGNPYLGPDGLDWPDNDRRFAALGWAAGRFTDGAADGGWRPDIVHGHDWHAGLAPAYLAARGGYRAASVFTVHNLAFQGLFPAGAFPALGLPASFFALNGLEFHGKLSFMKAGLYYADRLTTVSPTYAREIQTVEHGAGLHGLLASRSHVLSGILNGVDQALWDPARDPVLAAPFSASQMAGKAIDKSALQQMVGLEPRPDALLFGVVSRLTEQKGLDLMLQALPTLLAEGGQLVLLGSGDRPLEEGFARMAAERPAAVAVRFGYDEELAHRIVAGADVVPVPSRFEPCGLTQLYALRYGSLPLVRRVGGLADTVVDADPAAIADGSATGFVFEAPTAEALVAAARRAFAAFRDPDLSARLRHRAMTRDFGWPAAAAQYIDLYRQLRPEG